jgi:type I restriction enzyme, S subunit
LGALCGEYLPSGWVYVDLADYALEVSTGPFGSALHQSDYIVGGIPLVNPSHMVNDRIVADQRISIPKDIADRLSSYRLEPGDIVMARRGEVGRAALVELNQKGWLCGTGSFFLRFSPEINRHYFLLLLRSTPIRTYLAGKAVGTTMVNLNHSILKSTRLAIPPLAEQHRIVAKVDELMALCDQLEAELAATQENSRRLLEAVLHDALAPAMEQAA